MNGEKNMKYYPKPDTPIRDGMAVLAAIQSRAKDKTAFINAPTLAAAVKLPVRRVLATISELRDERLIETEPSASGKPERFYVTLVEDAEAEPRVPIHERYR